MSFFGPRDFLTPAQVSAAIEHSKNFRPGSERPNDAQALLFFETTKQRTWLVATTARAYCILDDRRKLKPHINWSISRAKIFDAAGQLVLELEASERHRRSSMSGHLHFGPKHRPLLTKSGVTPPTHGPLRSRCRACSGRAVLGAGP